MAGRKKKRRWIVSHLRVKYKGRRVSHRGLRKILGKKAERVWARRKKFHRSAKGNPFRRRSGAMKRRRSIMLGGALKGFQVIKIPRSGFRSSWRKAGYPYMVGETKWKKRGMWPARSLRDARSIARSLGRRR